MTTIHFDQPETWCQIVEDALETPDALAQRLSAAGIDQAHWDCSGLDDVLADSQLQKILSRITHRLSGLALRLYHGCRLHNDHDPRQTGMQPSSCAAIADSLLVLAAHDAVLAQHVVAIRSLLQEAGLQQQIRSRDGQIWFCLTEREAIEDGGVYVAFGSEFRLYILNTIQQGLGRRLFYYGRPAIIAVDLPIDIYLDPFRDNIAKFLFSLWIHHRLRLDDINAPRGFACWIKTPIAPEHVVDLLKVERVYDQYNRDSRWYSWTEIDLAQDGHLPPR